MEKEIFNKNCKNQFDYNNFLEVLKLYFSNLENLHFLIIKTTYWYGGINEVSTEIHKGLEEFFVSRYLDSKFFCIYLNEEGGIMVGAGKMDEDNDPDCYQIFLIKNSYENSKTLKDLMEFINSSKEFILPKEFFEFNIERFLPSHH